MELRLNDEYMIPNGAGPLIIKIVKLGINTRFLVGGNGVQSANEPREMSTISFSNWLLRTRARKIRATRRCTRR